MLSNPTTPVLPLRVTRLHPAIGAEIGGLDLSRPLAQPQLGAIRQAWLDHQLLVFPGQAITDAQQIAFAGNFGALEIHPSKMHRSTRHPEVYRVANVGEDGNILPPEGEAWRYLNITWLWHSDSSFREIPSMGSILHGIEVPAEGGDTLFCNLCAVYEALPEAMRRRLRGLSAVHSHDAVLQRGKLLERNDRYEALDSVRHPLVRRHPETGRLSLFISPHSMSGVVGMPDGEARALLDELHDFATQDRFVYRHRWRRDDVIMWDNRSTMHAVMPYDNAGQRRIMHRTTIVGEAPVVGA